MTNQQQFSSAAKRFLVGCMIILLALPAGAQAFRSRRNAFAGGDDFHFGYLSGSVGYSMLQTNFSGAMPRGAVGGSVGLGYEFRNNGLWTSVGAQLSFHRSSLAIDEYVRDFDGFDMQGSPSTFHYRVNQVDEIQWNSIDVPIMAGYYVRGFHVGAGVKVSYALSPNTLVTGKYNISATNHDLAVTFENMPDRGYTDYDYKKESVNQLNVGVGLIGEIGYDLLSSVPTSSRICHVLKIAFYFEYGLNNVLRNSETPSSLVELPQVTPGQSIRISDVIVNPYMNTFANPSRTVPFYTGVKLTYMIGGSRTARAGFHHGCMCYN